MRPQRGSALALLTAPPTRLADRGAAANPVPRSSIEAVSVYLQVYLQMHVHAQLIR